MTGRRVRSLPGRAAVLAVTLPLAGGVLLAVAPAAGAAVTAPGDGTVFTSYGTVEIRASYPRSTSDHRLTLTSPGGAAVTVATAPADLDGGAMTYRLDTGCWTYPSSSCTGRRLAPNGQWTVTQSGGASGSSTFVTRIRPLAPTSVTAAPASSREVRVGWRMGDEPDLVGWDVLEGTEVVKSGLGRSVCSSGTCSTVVTYAAEGSGEHTYTLRAHRSVSPGSSATLTSPLSAPATARLDPPPPSPAPAPAPAPETAPAEGGTGGNPSGGSGSGNPSGGSGSPAAGDGASSGGSPTASGTPAAGAPSAGGSPSGGATAGPDGSTAPLASGSGTAGDSADEQAVAQRKAFALTFSTFGPKLGIPKLPPLPQEQAPAIAPEPDGSYDPTLGFQDQVVRERVELTQGQAQRVRTVVGTALDSERLLRSTAGALILLLLGAHLRRWLTAVAKECEH